MHSRGVYEFSFFDSGIGESAVALIEIPAEVIAADVSAQHARAGAVPFTPEELVRYSTTQKLIAGAARAALLVSAKCCGACRYKTAANLALCHGNARARTKR